MQLVKPTPSRAALLWWSIAWRSLVLGLAGGIAAGVVIGIVGFVVGLDDESIALWSRIAAVLIGTPSCIVAAYSRLGKTCGDFRLVLVSIEDSPSA